MSNIHCKGGSLEDLLKAEGSFENSLIEVYAEQLLMGLAYLHDRNIVHGDLKGMTITYHVIYWNIVVICSIY